MTSPRVVNSAASVKARLLNLARQTGRPFQELLQYFGMERFLFRLGLTAHGDRFILKGALLFHVWDLQDGRATRDIDMLAVVDNSPDYVAALVRDVCKIEVDCLDGVVYEPNSVIMEVMQSQREYEGVRVRFHARLESAKIPMQIDLGFGDVVTPAPEQIAYPTLLDLLAPTLRGYPVETVIAEKLHTMVEKGMLNSRVKDYHDVWMLLRWGRFYAEVLERALVRTFEQRETRLDRMQLFQIIERYGATAEQRLLWERYRRKGTYETAPQNLAQVCSDIILALKDQW